MGMCVGGNNSQQCFTLWVPQTQLCFSWRLWTMLLPSYPGYCPSFRLGLLVSKLSLGVPQCDHSPYLV
jgi:hypothetical protein